MRVYNEIVNLRAKQSAEGKKLVIALGTFDGVHKGHQSILKKARELAKSIGGKSMAFTFSEHPLSVLFPGQAPRMLRDNATKVRLMAAMGMHILMNVPFSLEFASLTPEDFLAFLRDTFAPSYVVVGPNYTFGQYGAGNRSLLVDKGEAYGFRPVICPPVVKDGDAVSSTRIRRLVRDGELALANAFLGWPLTYTGTVMHGQARGRTLGFRTANLPLLDDYATLANGVYVIRARSGDDVLDGVASIGVNPTFIGCDRRLEAHLFDFARDIYGTELRVEFIAKLRDEQKFSSVFELEKQITHDVETAREILQASPRRGHSVVCMA